MEKKAGIWIDHSHATIVLLNDAETTVTKIAFEGAQSANKQTGATHKNAFTRNDFVPEDRLERKMASDLKKYYREVLTALHGVSSVLIIGPGEAKGELSKLIEAEQSRGLSVAIETADKMTDPQLSRKVEHHFAAETTGKSNTSSQ